VKIRLTTLEVLKAMRGRWAAAFAFILTAIPNAAYSQQKTEPKPNILVIMGDVMVQSKLLQSWDDGLPNSEHRPDSQ
jgi:hypothetical protein